MISCTLLDLDQLQVMAESEETWKEWIDKYIKEFVIYVAKDPKDFFVRFMLSLSFS